MRTTVTAWISTAVRLGLGAVMVTAGALKAIDPAASVAAVRAYELLPAGLATWVGWGLPFVEIVLGLFLIGGLATRLIGSLTAALIAVFIAAVISAAVRGLSIDCGCFGGGGPVAPGQTAYTAEIVRDLGLFALAAWLVARPHSVMALDRIQEGDSDE